MNKILKIAATDLKLFFFTPVAYLVSFSFFSVNGLLFWYLVNKANIPGESVQGIMNALTGDIVFWLSLFIVIPVIAMRLIAFDEESKRFSHLLSAPVASVQILLGKFLCGLLFYLFLWIPVFLYFLILLKFSKPDPGVMLSGFMGIFLIGCFSVSIGLFASSMCKTQITAAIFTFFLLTGVLLLSMFENLLGNSGLKDFFQYLNFVEHFIPFTEGIVDTRDICFFLSGSTFFLTLAHEIILWKREQIS